eukprot:evm.model.scf_531.3 EVM.evm.TU.scf_531.3   scf_531:13935-21183(-)
MRMGSSWEGRRAVPGARSGGCCPRGAIGVAPVPPRAHACRVLIPRNSGRLDCDRLLIRGGRERQARGKGVGNAMCSASGGNAGHGERHAMSVEIGEQADGGIMDRLRPAVCVGLAVACCLASRLPSGIGSARGGGVGASVSAARAVDRGGGRAGTSGRWASIAQANRGEAGRRVSWRTALRYRVQKIMMKNMGGKLLAILAVALPIILVGGVAYRMVTNCPWHLAFFRAYLLMGDVPGGDAAAEESNGATIIANIIFLYGLLTFAVVLGVVCDDISTFVTNVRNGNTDVVEEGHTVVLNVNRQLPSVLRQMSHAKHERRSGTFSKPVVILADMDKSELDDIVNRANGDLCNIEVYTRRGNVIDKADLMKVAADQAQTIIMLQPEDEDNATIAAKRAASIASLKALGTGKNRCTQLVVQSPEKEESMEGLTNVMMARNNPPLPTGSQLNVVEMHAAQTLDRMLAQCALQPGLGSLYSEILEQGEGREFYIDGYPSLAGSPHHVVRKHFDAAVVCGYLKGNNLMLNPSENEIYNEGDQIVLLAQDYSKTKPMTTPLGPGPDWVHNLKRTYAELVSKKVIVLGWTNKIDGLLDGFDKLAPKGTQITVVCSEKPPSWGQRHHNIRVHFVEGSPASFRALEEAGLHDSDSVIVAGLQELDASTADAQVLSTVLQIEDLSSKTTRTKPLHVVATINEPRTKEVATHLVAEANRTGVRSSVDLLLPDELSSGVLTQVAAQPKLSHVVQDLMNPSKMEMYIRNCTDYGLMGRGAITWHEAAEAVRANGETAIGYIDKNGTSCTAPAATSKHAFEDGDNIVVLATDYVPT